uniref:Si:dkey-256h2.1 n=1 Tax=Neogobius melanostomus TaxID=47308 RepID=A0A8C6TMP4_9GOBI
MTLFHVENLKKHILYNIVNPIVKCCIYIILRGSQLGPVQRGARDLAAAFSVPTLDGRFVYEPGLFRGSLVIHAFTNKSAFLESLWSSAEALAPLVHELPQSAHVLFLSLDDSALSDALWMKEQLGFVSQRGTLSRLHFSPVPVFALGNWIPAVLNSWGCTTHNCGLSQAVFTSGEWKMPVIVKRLDARYDWLTKRWGQRSYRLVDAGDGCVPSPGVEGAVAWVSEDGCSFFTKVQSLAKSNVSGVLVYAGPGKPIRDMTCEGAECDPPALDVPAAMVHLEPSVVQALRLGQSVNVSFQATPSPKFFICIDQQGALVEMGGFLYPTFKFINWQAQWFDFHTRLLSALQIPATVLSVFDRVQMQGQRGARATVHLPPEVLDSDLLELEVSLTCPSSRDMSCAHWDRTVQLFVCCDPQSEHCNTELGRWITAFRRGSGHWLTDVSPLLPLLDSPTCSFTMKTDPWAMPWVVSLNLRFNSAPLRPFRVTSLYTGGTFDKGYNERYQTFQFMAPDSTKKVELYAVITGHGSDENECVEFCVTSHHFTVNSVYNNTLTFNAADSPLGCTLKVSEGAVPNEYGTWLYGRGGWCCGLQVDPWRVDLTQQLDLSGSNSVLYSGLFEDRHPNPSAQPGYIIMSSFLVFYK